MSDRSVFAEPGYERINSARLQHLGSLGLPLGGRSVLEVGAGVGDLTGFFLERCCRVTATDARPENVDALRERAPGWPVTVAHLDLDDPLAGAELEPAEVVFAYGVLYHLREPAHAIEVMAKFCSELLLLETCVSSDFGASLFRMDEDASDPRNSVHGYGCRPTREWVRAELADHFPHVYFPRTQPAHADFPLAWDWTQVTGLKRAVFVASRKPLHLPALTETMPSVYEGAEVAHA